MPRTLLGLSSSNYYHRPKLTLYKVYKYNYILKYIIKTKNIFLNIIEKVILYIT